MKLKTASKVILLQINESMISIKESIIDALKQENKLLKSKVLNLEYKLSQSEAHVTSEK